jgi:cbb3-type cytochrome oxidase subunit 3
MSLDKIVVFVLALLFFGGVAFLAWKSRRDGKSTSNPSSSAVKDQADSASPNQPKGKEKRSPNV